MNAKLLIIVLVAMLACAVASAQTTESTDSLTRQLQEVIVS